VDGNVDATCSKASGATFPLGVTTVTCSATDAHKNTGSSSFTVTVQDTTAPELTAPSQGNQVIEATGPDGAAATWDAVAANDMVDGPLPVSCNHNSGDTFPIDTTTVTCSATDDSDNTGHTAFTIQVQDTTAPVVTVPADMTVEATGAEGAKVDFPASALDTVDGAMTTTCTASSGSTFALGQATVTCTATDAHNNTGTATFHITVVDTTAPDLTLPEDKTLAPRGTTRHQCRRLTWSTGG
jgi:hypothetical protein